MEYIHVRNLEKYHPGYKDRTLQWGKIYINMASGDPDTEMIENETDWARLVKIILLELRAQKPLPNTDTYWERKGFDLKKRAMSLTLQMLHNFLDTVTDDLPSPLQKRNVDKIREDKSRVDTHSVTFTPPSLDEVKAYCKERNNSVNAERFTNFYASKGWMIGKNKMKDWQAAIRTWEKGENGGSLNDVPESLRHLFRNK